MLQRTAFLAAILACLVWAADPTGTWRAEFQTPNGQTRTTTFNLKAEGGKLTGTVVGGQGAESKIEDGKIDGDNITFSVMRNFGGNEVKLTYKGKVSADQIQFNVSFGGEREFDMVAKRVQ